MFRNGGRQRNGLDAQGDQPGRRETTTVRRHPTATVTATLADGAGTTDMRVKRPALRPAAHLRQQHHDGDAGRHAVELRPRPAGDAHRRARPVQRHHAQPTAPASAAVRPTDAELRGAEPDDHVTDTAGRAGSVDVNAKRRATTIQSHATSPVTLELRRPGPPRAPRAGARVLRLHLRRRGPRRVRARTRSGTRRTTATTPAGAPARSTLPGGAVVGFSHDAMDRLTGVTLPGGAEHRADLHAGGPRRRPSSRRAAARGYVHRLRRRRRAGADDAARRRHRHLRPRRWRADQLDHRRRRDDDGRLRGRRRPGRVADPRAGGRRPRRAARLGRGPADVSGCERARGGRVRLRLRQSAPGSASPSSGRR